MSLKKSMLSKINTESLKKIDANITKILIIMAALFVIEFLSFMICCMCGMDLNIENIEWVIPICLTFVILIFVIHLSTMIPQEICRRKNDETIGSLNSGVPKKIKLNGFGFIDCEELFKDAEMEAEYNSEKDAIFITFIITGDDNCTKISKTVEFEKDDIVSEIEII